MTAKKSTAAKKSTPKKAAVKPAAPETSAPEAEAAPVTARPQPDAVVYPPDAGDKIKSLFAEARSVLTAPYDEAPKMTRMVRLALKAIDMAENACERHLKHSG